MRRARRAAALAAGLLAAACATSARPAFTPEDVAGVWKGRMQTVAGHAVTSLEIAPDGRYRGAMHLDGGDREFHGAVVSGPFGGRYRGSNGAGTVTLEGTAAGRVLRFRPDGGGPGSEFTPSRP